MTGVRLALMPSLTRIFSASFGSSTRILKNPCSPNDEMVIARILIFSLARIPETSASFPGVFWVGMVS